MSHSWMPIVLLLVCFHASADEFDKARDATARGDYDVAIATYSGPAQLGNATAQFELATLYHEGRGVPRDPGQALYWYTKAGERGNIAAQYWLCIMHREGIGAPRDYGEAFYWCKRAAERGDPQALFAVGQYYFDGLGHGFHSDQLNAYIWFSRARLQGNEDAASMIERLEREMPPLQVSEAQRLARDWHPLR